MSDLTDLYIDDGYPGLLHANASALPTTGQEDIYDGMGNKSSLKLGRACEGATICGTLTVDDIDVIGTSLLNKIYPIGSVYFSALELTTSQVGSMLGGTWSQVATGRFIAGVGAGTDVNTNSQSLPAGNGPGEYTHTLTIQELPKHSHSPIYANVDEDDNPDAIYNPTYSIIGNNRPGAFSYFLNSTTGATGSDIPHNNIPPAFGLYVFQRTA